LPTIHRPRRGSLAYSPRKRAKSEVPRVRSFPGVEREEPRFLGFAGYKAGMTHVLMVDDRPNSLTSGMEVSVPVTVLETPPMKVAALRVYSGGDVLGEAWADDLEAGLEKHVTKSVKKRGSLSKCQELVENGKATDVRGIVYTLPDRVSGVPKKESELMECGVAGSLSARFEYLTSMLGKSFEIKDVFGNGDLVDVTAVTKGKGTQGPVKRWGIQLMKSKHSRQGSLRQIGNLGPWRPAHVSWRVPQLGQTGYQQRTEFNKQILKIGEDGGEVTPTGGFLHYGVVRNGYALVKGSVPGPVKRLVRLRHAIRPKPGFKPREPSISYISLESKQGL